MTRKEDKTNIKGGGFTEDTTPVYDEMVQRHQGEEKLQLLSVYITQAKVSNQGVVSFKPLSFEAAGTYYYRILQVIPDTDKISYDSMIYNFVVTVYHDNNHKLAADVIAYKEGFTEKTGDIHFTNTYLLSSTRFATKIRCDKDSIYNSGRQLLVVMHGHFYFLDSASIGLQEKRRCPMNP